jgi:hypothetical protein
MTLLHILLTLYSWLMVSALIVIVYRIARFYQLTSGRRSYYQLFGVPLALLTGSALIYAAAGVLVGQAAADVLAALGGAALMVLGGYLLRLMTGSRS